MCSKEEEYKFLEARTIIYKLRQSPENNLLKEEIASFEEDKKWVFWSFLIVAIVVAPMAPIALFWGGIWANIIAITLLIIGGWSLLVFINTTIQTIISYKKIKKLKKFSIDLTKEFLSYVDKKCLEEKCKKMKLKKCNYDNIIQYLFKYNLTFDFEEENEN